MRHGHGWRGRRSPPPRLGRGAGLHDPAAWLIALATWPGGGASPSNCRSATSVAGSDRPVCGGGQPSRHADRAVCRIEESKEEGVTLSDPAPCVSGPGVVRSAEPRRYCRGPAETGGQRPDVPLDRRGCGQSGCLACGAAEAQASAASRSWKISRSRSRVIREISFQSCASAVPRSCRTVG